jgi:hypothetical protein
MDPAATHSPQQTAGSRDQKGLNIETKMDIKIKRSK